MQKRKKDALFKMNRASFSIFYSVPVPYQRFRLAAQSPASPKPPLGSPPHGSTGTVGSVGVEGSEGRFSSPKPPAGVLRGRIVIGVIGILGLSAGIIGVLRRHPGMDRTADDCGIGLAAIRRGRGLQPMARFISIRWNILSGFLALSVVMDA